MSETTIQVYTIGQTPRPDLTDALSARCGPARFRIWGALDGLPAIRIPECPADGYPLETRMHDGTRVVVGAEFLETRLQEAISVRDDHRAVHLVLCAGFFPGLHALGTLIQPFEAAVADLTERGFDSLEVVVPFTAQAEPSGRKWGTAGFACRVHALDEKPAHATVAAWLTHRLGGTTAQALVFDYVGFPATILEDVTEEIRMPVLDVGRLGIEALERELDKRRGPTR